jgi:hypothetical protein
VVVRFGWRSSCAEFISAWLKINRLAVKMAKKQKWLKKIANRRFEIKIWLKIDCLKSKYG